MRISTLASALLAIQLANTATHAQTRYSLEIARKVVGLGSPRVSPDGQRVAFLVTRPNFEDNRNESELWLADAVAGGAHALTLERHTVASPQWSPDGATIAFLGTDDKDEAQVWLPPMRGGEARRLT